MKKITVKSFSDAGHGWLGVKRKLLERLSIEHLISPYSYQRGASVYLEEDCDASIFIKAFEKHFGYTPEVKGMKWVDYSPIRSYECYSHASHNLSPDDFREAQKKFMT